MAIAELEAEMLTPAQAARMLRRSKVRVLQLTDAGALPCVRTPLGRLLPAAAVRDFVKARDGSHRSVAASQEADPAPDEPAPPAHVTHDDLLRLLGLTAKEE